MNCEEVLRVHAYFDGELDATDSASVQRHLGECAACRALLADLERTRASLRSVPRVPSPPSLRARIHTLLDAQPAVAAPRARERAWHSRNFWMGAFAGLGASAAAVVLVVLLVVRWTSAPLVDGLFAAHMHSLVGDHLIAVASGAPHAVKPWFAGRADVAPTVTDFSAQGFVLAGGRVDDVDGRRSAVMVYRHGAHVVNVFSWPANNLWLSRKTTRRGYRMLFWNIEDVAYCAVSDTAWSELVALEDLMRAQAAADRRLPAGRE
jgi:anti-sigma factor RsiW